MPLVIPNSIQNDTPADAAELQANFTEIQTYVNSNLVDRDGTVALDAPLLLPGDPTQPNHAANKGYVDAQDALRLPLTGGTVTGAISSAVAPTSPDHLTNKAYVDTHLTSAEADALFLTSAEADALFLTPAEANALFLTPTVTGSLTIGSPAAGTGPGGWVARSDGHMENCVTSGTSTSVPNFNVFRGGGAPNDVGGRFVVFHSGATGIGLIDIGPTTSATRYSTSSDYRLKEELGSVDEAVARIGELRPIHFRWKSDGYEQDGFFAHEVAEVVPAAVSGEKDAVDEEGNVAAQMIDNNYLVPLLVAAVQELSARIAALEAA